LRLFEAAHVVVDGGQQETVASRTLALRLCEHQLPGRRVATMVHGQEGQAVARFRQRRIQIEGALVAHTRAVQERRFFHVGEVLFEEIVAEEQPGARLRWIEAQRRGERRRAGAPVALLAQQLAQRRARFGAIGIAPLCLGQRLSRARAAFRRPRRRLQPPDVHQDPRVAAQLVVGAFEQLQGPGAVTKRQALEAIGKVNLAAAPARAAAAQTQRRPEDDEQHHAGQTPPMAPRRQRASDRRAPHAALHSSHT